MHTAKKQESGMRTSALVVVVLVTLGCPLSGCAPVGQGDPCVPESIPANGFVTDEVYVETSSVQCRTRVCMVYHLTGNPECAFDDPRCNQAPGANNPCVFGTGADNMLCVEPDDPTMIQRGIHSPDRVFCTCRCSASGNASLPLCQCTDGFRCVPDTEPGGGYCVPNDLALAAGICANDGECATPTRAGTCGANNRCQ
jgi:hypothetical protein